jgi:hypothetical protein
VSGTGLAILRRPPAEYEAARQYGRAVERHFAAAQRLLAEGDPDAAERIAKGAAALRIDARYELRGER